MPESIDRVAQTVRDALDLVQDVPTRMSIDREAGIVKIYSEKSDALAKASSGLAEVLELAYTTAEHHPYWGMLYHATEISKMILEKWESDLSADNISEISWRCDEIKMALERAAAGDMHHRD